MREYALIPESEITAARAAKFQVVSNFNVPYVWSSHLVTDLNGQESEIYDDYAMVRWVESGEEGFLPDQVSEIAAAITNFNQGRGNKPKLPNEKGNSEWARERIKTPNPPTNPGV